MQRHCSLFKMVKGYFKDRNTGRIFKDIPAGVNKKTQRKGEEFEQRPLMEFGDQKTNDTFPAGKLSLKK
jgi:hypothetical protein